MHNKGSLDVKGNITGKHIIKEGGTSNQFLKADGTVDDSLYIIDGEIDGVLYGRKDHQWVEITGGGGGLQNLQEVTDIGNETTNNITVTDGDSTYININNKVIESFYPRLITGFRLSEDTLTLGNSEYTSSYTRYHKTRIEYRSGLRLNGILLYPNLGHTSTGETIATQEWVNTNVGGVLTTTVEISSAQLLALASTPVELIPAQGAGTYISIENYIYSYEYGTEDYDFNPLPKINGVTAFGGVFFVNLLGNTSKVVRCSPSDITLSENTPITLEYSGTAPTQGDGTLKLILTYKIINI